MARPREELEAERAALSRSIDTIYKFFQTDHVGVAAELRSKEARLEAIDAELASHDSQEVTRG